MNTIYMLAEDVSTAVARLLLGLITRVLLAHPFYYSLYIGHFDDII